MLKDFEGNKTCSKPIIESFKEMMQEETRLMTTDNPRDIETIKRQRECCKDAAWQKKGRASSLIA